MKLVGNSMYLIFPARMVSFAHEKVYWVTEDDTCHMSEGASQGHEESTKRCVRGPRHDFQ